MADILILETSTPHASIARVGPAGLRAQHHFTSDRNHNALLFEPLSDLLKDPSRHEIDLILVGSGPGSYSGTRVGIAAAQGIALALQCPAIGIPSILAVDSASNGSACLAIGDARRGSYWSALMEQSRLVHDPELCNADELTQRIEQAAAKDLPVIAFESADRFPIREELRHAILTEYPDAHRLWQVWNSADDITRAHWQQSIPQPIYLKPPHITPGKRPRLID